MEKWHKDLCKVRREFYWRKQLKYKWGTKEENKTHTKQKKVKAKPIVTDIYY